MGRTITIRRKVEFHETDMAGIVHFSNFYRYMEAAEAGLFAAHGLALIDRHGDYGRGWPRVSASMRYESPLHFGDLVEIRLEVVEVKAKGLRFACEIDRATRERTLVPSARGEMSTVFVERDPDSGRMRAHPIPPEVVEAFSEDS